MTVRAALLTFFFWVAVALGADVLIWVRYGPDLAAQFFGAWVLEETLSLDNLFMFYFIFTVFQTPREARPRVLRWGIIGVVAMRGAIIAGGLALIHEFSWLLLGFAAFLLWAAVKIFLFDESDGGTPEEKREALQQNWLLRLARRVLPFDTSYHGDRFIVSLDRRRKGTLLLLVVFVIEGTDLPFAFDSLPAAMAVSQSFPIVITSNVLAVLGLRSIYFLIESMQQRFAYMKHGIGVLLGFAGVKILLDKGLHVHVPLGLSLGIIVGVIVLTIAYTLYRSAGRRGSPP